MRHSMVVQTTRSRGEQLSVRLSDPKAYPRPYRINLETGEQTVLSEHAKAANCVVYNKEHCEFF